MNRKTMGMLGLAARAGKIASGEFQTEKSVKSGRARLVLLAEDASDGTKKKFTDSCTYYHVPWVCLPVSKEELGHAIGRQVRSSAAIEDEGMADAFRKNLIQAGLEGILTEEMPGIQEE